MKKLLVAIGVFATFAVGYGAATAAYPTGGMYGRGQYYGYFTDDEDYEGTFVFPRQYQGGTEAMPNTINSATEFINFIKYTQLDIDGNGSSNAQERTGAAFIIQTMIGSSRNRPPTNGEIREWERRVNFAEDMGWITWRANYSFGINSYYQGTHDGSNPNDDAFFDESGTRPAILFRDSGGGVAYAIKWDCANPVGRVRPIEDDRPLVNFNITGRSSIIAGSNPLPGQTVRFRHYLRNTGPTATNPTNIWWIWQNPSTGATTGGAANSGTYAAGQEKQVGPDEYVTVPVGTLPGTQICRRVGWDPVNESGTRDGRGAPACTTVRYDFSLTPNIVLLVNGAVPSESIAQVGDTITFNYSVINNGLTQSQLANCTIYGLTRTGSYAVPTPHDSASDPGYVPPPTGCPRTFPSNSTTNLPSESITATSTNNTICRSLWVNPATPTGGNRSFETCVRIVAKPYLKVYGGDIAAGSGFETAPYTCVNNNNAAITSWNKQAAGTFAGAGVQYAGYALNAITDFATGHGYAPANTIPSWLSFANTTVDYGMGNFGGNIGSVPCIPDYYGRRPATTSALPPNVSAMVTGNYGASGLTTLNGGNVSSDERIVVYVDGDVFINGNITYTPNWDFDSVPLFQLVVRGNIYIGSGVTQLDGIYSAQRNGATGGTIYTCATAALAPTLTSNAFYGACNNRLVVNGAFMANSIEFLRTAGTLSQSTVGESSPASTAGEVFNFNPSLWMVQPPTDAPAPGGYDAITSLPPVL